MLKYLHTVSDSAVFLYPLPSPKELEFVSWGEFTMDAKGLTTSKVGKNGQTAGKEGIASAFEVLGACRDPHGCGWGLWLQWKDPDQRIHTHHVTNAALQGDASALCGGLADEGLRIKRFPHLLGRLQRDGPRDDCSPDRLARYRWPWGLCPSG